MKIKFLSDGGQKLRATTRHKDKQMQMNALTLLNPYVDGNMLTIAIIQFSLTYQCGAHFA